MNNQSLFSNLKHDFPASIVVFLVAIPLCLGIALASGAPLFSGVVAGIVGGIIVGALSGSSLGVSGPAAGLAVLVFEGIRELGTDANGNFDMQAGFEAFLVAGLLAGIIQLILGFAKAGIIGYFFPSSVIRGMLAGIGVTLILKQIPHALGYDKNPEGAWDFYQVDGHNTLSEIIYSIQNLSPGAVIITLVSLAILLGWQRPFIQKNKILALIPGPLLAVVVGVLINEWYKLGMPTWYLGNESDVLESGQKVYNNHLVKIDPADPDKPYFGLLVFPDFSVLSNARVYVIGITMAIVASLETLLSVEATDKLDPYKRTTPTNRELLAQGTGNVVSSLIGGLPVTQVIVRSTANVSSGGKTKMSAILHGIIMLVFVLLLPNILNMIPLSCLAAILLTVGYKLASVKLFKSIYINGKSQFIPFVVTILMIVFTNLLYGIVAGLVVAIAFILKRSYNTAVGTKTKESDDNGKHIVRIEMGEIVSFFNKGNLHKQLDEVENGSKVILDCTKTQTIDYDIKDIINDFKDNAKTRDIEIEIIDENFKLI